MKVIKRISFVWALQQCATRFYEGLNNAHLLLSVSFKRLHHDSWRSQKKASPLCERFSNVHHGFMKGFKNVHLLLWGFKNLHHNLWRSEQFAAPLTSASKFCIAIHEGLNKLHLRMHLRLNCKCKSLNVRNAFKALRSSGSLNAKPNGCKTCSAWSGEEFWWRRGGRSFCFEKLLKD